ncbi:MAG: ATP-binding cassette domain-containing protein [Fimbriimonadaceae bacterium]
MEPAVYSRDLVKTYVTHKKQPGVGGAIRGLVTREKRYIEAVKGISLQIEQGELVGFLGPNGAGKTTTLKMLSGILYPTSGECKVLGYDPWKRDPAMLRQISLVMGNKMQLWWDLPAWDSFMVLKELYEVDSRKFKQRTEALIDALQLQNKVHTQVRRLSLGERMKCELVAALLHAPRVVFLDEPTLGLDVVSQKKIREFLLTIHQEDGCTILLTSHYMQDVEELCDRVIIINLGTVVFEGTLEKLSQQYSDDKMLRFVFEREVLPEELAAFGVVHSCEENSALIEVPRRDTARVTGAVLQALPVVDVSIEEVEIEEVIRRVFSPEPVAPPSS